MDTFGEVDAFLAQMDAELPATAAALEGATVVPQQPAPAAATPAPAIGQPALVEQPAAAAAVPAGQPAAAAQAQQAPAMPCKDDILAAMQVINILDSQGIYHVSAAQLHLAQRVFKACLDAATPLTEEQDQLVAKAMQHAHMTELLSGEHAQQRVNDKQFHHHIREEVKFLQANEEPLNQAMQKKRTHPYGAATNRLKFLKEKYGKAAEVGANKPAGKGHGNGANGNSSGNGKNGNSQYVPKSVKDARSAAGQCIQCGSSSHKKCDNWRR
uniref:Uncharacterized protein n=1 Tax=Tetradesmus obliquus TaxID=3088 RepID=A0A383WNK5_TETOB|eukprot:jgi/Sobl393_1/17414/SZX79037.1